MTLNLLSPTAARRARRPVLQAAVDTSARCNQDRYRDLFDRNLSSPPATWAVQQAAALQLCAGCPARAACEELALRDGIGDRASNDLVRGGRRGQDLAVDREIRQPRRIADAVAADRRELFTLVYAMETGPVTRRGLRRKEVERVGEVAMRVADRGEAWDIAVYNGAGVDVTGEFAFARGYFGALPIAA